MGKRCYELVIIAKNLNSNEILDKESFYPATKEQIQKIAKEAAISTSNLGIALMGEHFETLE